MAFISKQLSLDEKIFMAGILCGSRLPYNLIFVVNEVGCDRVVDNGFALQRFWAIAKTGVKALVRDRISFKSIGKEVSFILKKIVKMIGITTYISFY